MNRHLVSIDDVSVDDATMILDTAEAFFEVSRRPVRKVPTLRGKTVINLSTRARRARGARSSSRGSASRPTS